jgi:hypothetical protein
LSNLVRPGNLPVGVFFEAELPRVLLGLLAHPDAAVSAESAWVLTFLTARDDDAAAALVGLGVIPALIQALERSGAANPLATPALRALGNLVAIGESFAAAALDGPAFLKTLGHIFSQGAAAPRGLFKESIWVTSNLSCGPPAHRRAVLEGGLLRPLVLVLGSNQYDIQREVLSPPPFSTFHPFPTNSGG